ncbi:plasmid mobilization relaxosome protein MobC [Leucobacter sp. HNU]|uniref:plasmid mobilization relaxosome protein MobC n=1 Tax=Leucobacter sp. HNU TaxID=3236805 RepID=UPI003A81070A
MQGKKPAGRSRRENVSGGRGGRVNVRLSQRELQKLEEIRRATGQTFPRILVERALASDSGVTKSDVDEIIAYINGLSREFNRVGVNLNQIAHVVNAGGQLPPELRGPFAEILIELLQLARRSRGLYDRLEGQGLK